MLVVFLAEFVHRLHQRGGTHIYVSPGTGYWGPPMRLFTRAAISVLTLTP